MLYVVNLVNQTLILMGAYQLEIIACPQKGSDELPIHSSSRKSTDFIDC